MPKDRLGELKNLSNGCVYNDTVVVNENTEDKSDDIRLIFDEVQKIREWVYEINENTRHMKRLISNPTFQTSKSLQEELDATATRSNAAGLKVCGALRQFEERVQPAGNDARGRIARLQYATARHQYCAALADHQHFLQTHRDAQYALLQEQIKITNFAITDEECERLLDSNNVSLFVDNLQAETTEARLALRDVEERHHELLKIEGSIQEVRDLFVQMSHLIMQQQDLVDRVEYYASQATDNVEYGGKELLKGSLYKNKARKKQIGLIACVSIGFLVVLLVLIYT